MIGFRADLTQRLEPVCFWFAKAGLSSMQSNFDRLKLLTLFSNSVCFPKNEASSICHYNIFLLPQVNTVSFWNVVWFLSFCQCKKSFSSFGTNVGTGIKRNCSAGSALISGPKILLPSENTLVSFVGTSFAQGTEVRCLATKVGRVKGGFSVRRHLLRQGKDVIGFLYSLGTCSA